MTFQHGKKWQKCSWHPGFMNDNDGNIQFQHFYLYLKSCLLNKFS
jgi:hypothetical protein